MISPNWDVEFHVHIDASLLVVGAMLTQNLIEKHDQPVVYGSTLLNNVKRNYSTIECEVLAMIFALHKFRHYLLGNKFIFYVDHMALVYLVNKPQVSRCIARWLLLFLEYEFIIVYKPSHTHVVANALSRFMNTIDSIRVPNQIIDAALFMLQLIWLEEIKNYM